MLSRLSSGSGPLWLQQQSFPSSSTTLFYPLLLLPGDGGAAVEVEAPLLLAFSPLLRRTLASTCCGACSSAPATVLLPSITSNALNQLVQVLARGSVTIATDDLGELGALLALLEVDFGRAPGSKRKAKNVDLDTAPPVMRNLTSSPTASSPAAAAGISRISCDPNASKLMPPNSGGSPSSFVDPGPASVPILVRTSAAKLDWLVDPIPLSHGTAPEIKFPAEKLSKSSITCIYCDLEMPSGTDQNLYLQHLETCNAQQVQEAEHLQKKLKTEEEVVESGPKIESGSNAGNNFSEEKGNLDRKLKSFSCKEPGCGKSYDRRADLNAHKRNEHGAAKLKCVDSTCTSVEFTFDKALDRHMWVKHGVGKGTKCDECGKRLSGPFYLKEHMRASHGAPKIQCEVLGCDATFMSSFGMARHMKTGHNVS